LAQVAVKSALDECEDWLQGFVKHLRNMRDLCVEDLNKMEGISCKSPQGCYLVLPDITQTGMNAEEMQKLLLR
jgi:bifunctional pyridoxal-dependent enzyme with beta-cystathionase and maltose regulon repressor activities